MLPCSNDLRNYPMISEQLGDALNFLTYCLKFGSKLKS